MKTFASIVFFLIATCVYAQDWKSTYAEALSSAKDENKPIVLVFAGSDWCAPCIKLDKSIWQSSTFKEFSASNYVLYKADFPKKKANQLSKELTNENAALADRFNPKGYFPLVLVLDKNEVVNGTVGYKNISPEAYLSILNNFVP